MIIYNYQKKRTTLMACRIPFFLLTVVVALLTVPQTTFAQNVVGGEVLVQEPDVVQQDMEQADAQIQEINVKTNIPDGADTSEYDLVLEVPIHLERLYEEVESLHVNCIIGKGGNTPSGFEEGTDRSSRIGMPIIPGTYDLTFKFYFRVLAGQFHQDFDRYICTSYFYNSMMGQPPQGSPPGHMPVLSRDATENNPVWMVVEDGSRRRIIGDIEWE